MRKSKITSVRDMVVPFRVLSRKKIGGSKCQSTDSVPFKGKKLFGPRPQNRILVPSIQIANILILQRCFKISFLAYFFNIDCSVLHGNF